MSYETKAIVISSKDSKEKDKEVLLYSLEKGKVYAKFKGVKNQKSKLKAGKETFTFGDFFIEEGKAGNIVTGVNIIESFYDISQNIDTYLEACNILDIIKKLPVEESNPVLFVSIIKALRELKQQKNTKNIVFLKFLCDFFEINGYKFNFLSCSSCGAKLTGKKFINQSTGEIVCSNCKLYTDIEVEDVVMSAIKIIKNTEYEKLISVKFGDLILAKVLSFLSQNYHWRFGSAINIYN